MEMSPQKEEKGSPFMVLIVMIGVVLVFVVLSPILLVAGLFSLLGQAYARLMLLIGRMTQEQFDLSSYSRIKLDAKGADKYLRYLAPGDMVRINQHDLTIAAIDAPESYDNPGDYIIDITFTQPEWMLYFEFEFNFSTDNVRKYGSGERVLAFKVLKSADPRANYEIAHPTYRHYLEK